jgi:hypothetical protein
MNWLKLNPGKLVMIGDITYGITRIGYGLSCVTQVPA